MQLKQQTPDKFDAHLEHALQEIHAYYTEKIYEFPEKYLMIAEQKVAFLAAVYARFTSTLKKELATSEQLAKEARSKLEQVLREAKQEHRVERDRLEEQLRQSQTEKAKLEASNQILRDEHQILRDSKDQEIGDLRKQLGSLKSSQQGDVQKLKAQLEESQQRVQGLQREALQQSSEVEKDRCLLEQKIHFLSQSLQET